MEKTINNEQKIQAFITPETVGGNPAPIDGIPSWSVVEGESTLEIAPDGLSAFLISSANPGKTQYRVRADADMGEGVEEIIVLIDLTVEAAKAAMLGLSFGEAVPK